MFFYQDNVKAYN